MSRVGLGLFVAGALASALVAFGTDRQAPAAAAGNLADLVIQSAAPAAGIALHPGLPAGGVPTLQQAAGAQVQQDAGAVVNPVPPMPFPVSRAILIGALIVISTLLVAGFWSKRRVLRV